MKICFIDCLGLPYDGDTLSKRGLGGSESATILISKELVKLGLSVTVFNDCQSDNTTPGVYDGVEYIPISKIPENGCDWDVVISSRSVAPFATDDMKGLFNHFLQLPDLSNLLNNATHKVLLMHDTFCEGDQWIEDCIVSGRINEIFTLSDWHTNYISNADHGNGMKRRNYDILKNHIFQTRNGIGATPKEWIDVRQKDPNLFVFNSSVTKGMIPLIEHIWPEVLKRIPEAKLTVIGGYYRFREGSEPDDQEKSWRRLVESNPEINFTGIIKQDQISEILSKASYMIYPAAFPETFGISTLEALAHNVPLITCRFAALEETALDIASWKLNYPVEKNWSMSWLDEPHQRSAFVDLVVEAYNDKYLHQQRMYACNQIKDICTWDTVALQWLQHFCKVTGSYMSKENTRKVNDINDKVHKVFGRRFYNHEEVRPRKQKEKFISVITPVFNAEKYIERCILSVAQQDYDNFEMKIIDDCSTDNTVEVIEAVLAKLNDDRFTLRKNKSNIGAVYNQWSSINPEAINMLLDGDDCLVNDPYIFDKYNNLYHEGYDFTYGSCWSMADNIPLIAQEYPLEVIKNKSFRDYKFNWNMPYTHLRTFDGKLFNEIAWKDWQVNGEWPKAGGDTVVFYDLIERANKIKCVTDIVVNYNDLNPLNDYKVNGQEQTDIANKVLNMNNKKFSVVIPTMWRAEDLTNKLLRSLIECDDVGEIILIDNDPGRALKTIEFDTLTDVCNDKLIYVGQDRNIGVNPAWNLGVSLAKNDLIAIVNDDIIFDVEVFKKLQDRLHPGAGPYGIIDGDPAKGQPASTDYSIDFVEWKEGDCIHSFGQCFFIHKGDWIDIPPELMINFGDDYLFHTQRFIFNNPIHLIYNIRHETRKSSTVSDQSIPEITPERFEQERQWYESFHLNLLPKNKKKILIAIPTARYIEPSTFKSIYDLEIPDEYEVDFQYFFGYQVDQVRNLISDWVVRGYDYLFSVDHDISFPPDTLKKLLSHDAPYVTGIYRQRLEPQVLEIYDGEMKNVKYDQLKDKGLIEIGGSGFGCVLVKKEVIETIGYPQFEYHSALDHKDTFSEDLDFCKKARERGFRLYCDTTILCDHRGEKIFSVI